MRSFANGALCMRTLCTAAVLAALSSTSLALATDAERLEFAPPEGLRINKTFVLRHSLVVVEDQLLGKDYEQMSQDQLELESGLWMALNDTFQKVDGGRPTVFRRRFENVHLEAQAAMPSPTGPKTDLLQATSPLTDKSVIFTWIDEDGEYGRYYDVLDGVEEVLPRIAVDMNLAFLVPGREVAVGEQWSIPPAATRDLFGFGGDLPLDFTRDADILLARSLMFGVGGSLWHAYDAPPQGKVTAVFQEVRTIAGRRMAAVKLSVDLTIDVDQTELARATRNAIEITGGIEVDRAGLKIGLKGDGELLWDLERNVPHKLELVCEENVETTRETHRGDLPVLHAVTPSQRLRLVGALRVDLAASLAE
jgi:hypothetical protein